MDFSEHGIKDWAVRIHVVTNFLFSCLLACLHDRTSTCTLALLFVAPHLWPEVP